jgi:phosphoglycolate phosphatase
MKYTAIIFDLDGTLLNTLDDIADAANSVLDDRGFPRHEPDAYRVFVGDGVKVLISRILPVDNRDSQTITECVQAFGKIYGRLWDQKTRPYDGVVDLLDQLSARGIPLSVLSNKPENFTQRCINKFLPRPHFEVILGDNGQIARKPDPEGALMIAAQLGIPTENFIFVGDTPIDMKTAAAAGMHPVGVGWGFRKAQELIDAGAKKIIDHPLQLLDLLCR